MIILTKKKVDEILKRIAANEIIAIETPMKTESLECMVENNCEIAFLLGGTKGMCKILYALKKRYMGKDGEV